MEKTRSFNQENATLDLINKHFWKSKIGPICALSLPFFLMLIYRILGKENLALFEKGLSAYFSFSILPLCFISLPQMIVEFKTSIIMRKIAQSNISSLKFSVLILTYNLIAIIISSLIIILLYAIFLNVDAPKIFKKLNWGQMFYALFNIWISCLSFGLLIGVLVNRINLIQAIAFGIIIVSITFSGQFIPINVLARSEALRYITLLSPSSYGLNLLNVVLTDTNKDYLDSLYELYNAGLNHPPNLPPLPIPTITFSDDSVKSYGEFVESYKFLGIFDLNSSYKIFSFKVTDVTQSRGVLELSFSNPFIFYELPPEINNPDKQFYVSDLKETIVYLPWQLRFNIAMPYITTIVFMFVSIKKFKWTSR